MLIAFIIWLIGTIIAGILLQGNREWLENNDSYIYNEKDRTLKLLIVSSFSIIIVVVLVVDILLSYLKHKEETPTEPYQFPWQFPVGKHYAKLQKPECLVLLSLAGVGCFLLIHGVNGHCILMNMSMFITILVLFFAALHPIKTQKQLFWAILAMAGPMILDFILHLTITTSL